MLTKFQVLIYLKTDDTQYDSKLHKNLLLGAE